MLTIILQPVKLPKLPDAHIHVADVIGRRTDEALLLNIACGLNSGSIRYRRFPHSISAQLFIIHTWDFDMNVDAVQQWTRDPLLIFCHHCRRTGAGPLVFGNGSRHTPTGFLWITKMSAWSGTHHVDYLKFTTDHLQNTNSLPANQYLTFKKKPKISLLRNRAIDFESEILLLSKESIMNNRARGCCSQPSKINSVQPVQYFQHPRFKRHNI